MKTFFAVVLVFLVGCCTKLVEGDGCAAPEGVVSVVASWYLPGTDNEQFQRKINVGDESICNGAEVAAYTEVLHCEHGVYEVYAKCVLEAESTSYSLFRNLAGVWGSVRIESNGKTVYYDIESGPGIVDEGIEK